MEFTTKLHVRLMGENSLAEYDTNQDFVSMLELDLERWIATSTVERLICRDGEQVVHIDLIPHGSNLSDVTGEVYSHRNNCLECK